MFVQTNQPYTNRIQIVLSPFFGPFVQPGPLGDFDPRRDLEVYVDGVRQPVQTFSYDATNDRYLLFMQNAINLQGTVQIIYHAVSPPFQGRVQAEADATASTGAGSQVPWTADTNFALGQTIVDINGNIQTVVGVIGGGDTGTTGGTVPTWPQFTGGTVSDGNLIWATRVYQSTVSGFGAFDKSAQDGEPDPDHVLVAGPLAPANASTMAILAASAAGIVPASGWVDMGAPAGIGAGLLQLASFATPSPITVTETVTTRWASNLLLFAGSGVVLTASVTNVSLTSNVLTLTMAAPEYIVGTTLSFSGFVAAGFLNNHSAVILTNSGTHVTASFVHANYASAADSGTATYCPYLQAANIDGSLDTAGTYMATFPNPVQAGSTILVTSITSDNNASAVPVAVSDSQGGSYEILYAFSPGGLPANQPGSGIAFAQNAHGGATTVSVTVSPVHAAPGAISFFILELPLGAGVPFPEVPWVPGVVPGGTVTVNAPPTLTAPSLVQTNTVSTASSGGVCFGSFLEPPTAANGLAVFVYSDSNSSTVTIADNFNNSYTRQIYSNDGTDAIYAYSATANHTGTLSLSSVANHVGGQTTYTGIGIPTFNGLITTTVAVTGFSNSANNGSFTVSSTTPTTLTLNNGGGVAETHAATATAPIVVEVSNSSNSRTLIGLAELTDTVGVDVLTAVTNKLFSTDVVTSGNFTTSGGSELSIGFASSQGGVPGFTQNDGWAIAAPQNTAAIVTKAQPSATTDAAQIDTNTIVVFDSETDSSGVAAPNPATTTITTGFLTPSTSNTWATLFVGASNTNITPNGSWTPLGGSLFGHGYGQILTNTNPIQGSLQDSPNTFSGGGADGTPWGLVLVLWKLNGSVPPSATGEGFQISGAGGSGTGNFTNTSPGNTILIIQTSNWLFPTTLSISDSQGNTYQHFHVDPGPGHNGNFQSLDVLIAQNIVGGPNTVTFSNSNFVANWDIDALELEVGYEFRMSAMSFFGQPHAGTGPFSQTLTISGFDFPTAVPSNAAVTGLELVLHGSQSGSEFSSYLTVCPANPILASPPVFTVQLPATAGDVTLGSPTTTFGYTLTPAFVNDPANFVFYLQAADTNGQNVGFTFDSATVRAYYYTLQDIVLGATVSGFAEIGSFSTQGDDTLFPAQATLVPSSVSAPTGTAISLAWNTSAVSYIRITSGDSFDTGLIVVNGGQGTYVVPGSSPLLGTAGSVTFEMTCYDGNEAPIDVNGEASPNVMAAVYLT